MRTCFAEGKSIMFPFVRHATWRAAARARRRGAPTMSSASCDHASRLVLGIESSCDDTGIAIVSSTGHVLGESIASQADIHAPWGGVVPKLAQDAHQAAINSCVNEALQEAGITPADLDAIAVTVGPGLSLCLRVGVMKARQLAAAHQLPLIPVHHMEAHALVARLGAPQRTQQPVAAPHGGESAPTLAPPSTPPPLGEEAQACTVPGSVEFPFLCLLISGGHNLLLVVEGVGRYVQLGSTLDDALGEAYDKVARLLGLELKPSGGAALERFALEGDPHAVPLSVPMQRRPTCDFSFAGLKTAVRLAIEAGLGEEGPTEANRQLRADIAASFQRVAVQHLEERCRRAVGWARETHPGISQLVVAGGVASNQYVRGRLAAVAEKGGLHLVCPPPRLCTDNGVMVAWAGVERLRLGLQEPPPPPEAAHPPPEGESVWIDLRPRWPLTDRKDPRTYVAPRSAKKKNVFAALGSQLEGSQPAQQQWEERQAQRRTAGTAGGVGSE